MKIAVYAISLNEENHVERFCKSCKGADYIIIADTGSTDNTVKLARRHGAAVHDIKVTPWRFDVARNAALSLMPDDVDVCISLDLDEILVDNWRQIIEQSWYNDTTRLAYRYEWMPDYIFYADKIHSRKGYYWKYACHETLTVDPRFQEVRSQTDELLIIHDADLTKPRTQYLELLRVDYLENPRDPRTILYYGRELGFQFRHQESIEVLQKYNEISDTNRNEYVYANRLIAKGYKNLNDTEKQIEALMMAAEFEQSRETWVDLAEIYYYRNDWNNCLENARNAIAVTHRNTSYTQDPKAWGALIFDIASIAAWNLGKNEEAIGYTETALQYEPENERIQNNLKFMREESE